MFRYAQVNNEGYVVSDSHLSGEVKANNMIPVEEDFDLTNKKYINGEWVSYEPLADVATLSEEQNAIFETQANTEYLICMMEMQAI